MNSGQLNKSSSSSHSLAVITGASRGIGYELAKQFAEHGFDLLICADSAAIHDAARNLQKYGTNVEACQCDLCHYDGVEELWNRTKSDGRPIEVVAINAGVGVGGEFVTNDLNEEMRLIDLNIKSTIHLAKRAVNYMLPRGQGRILFTSSIASRLPEPYNAVYGASKAFVQSFSQALRAEVKDKGITITALMPGPTETNFFHRARMDDTKIGQSEKDDPAEVARDGYEALMSGKDHVIAGSFKNKVEGGLAASLLPETVTAGMHENQTKPGSARKKK